MANKIGVVLMTYGSATTAENVGDYLRHVYPNGVPEGLIEDFEQRYRLVGRSPLIDITLQQAAETEKALNEKFGDAEFLVRAGMLHSDPFIHDAVKELAHAGATRLVGVVLAPQYSPLIMRGYLTTLTEAAAAHGFAPEQVVIAEPWGKEPHFVQLLANRLETKLHLLRKKYGVTPPVIFTTHSLPKRVVEQDSSYLSQLKETVDAVVAKIDPVLEWYMAYQSAGHTPEEWLKPDLVDILDEVRAAKSAPGVLIVPLQFLADHLEILYDLDIAGGEQCQEYGLEYNRIELPNTDPLFITSLSNIVREAI